MFRQNIDEYYLAGVNDIGYYHISKDYNLPQYDKYVNSGVLLINLKMWRQENMSQKLFNTLKQYGDIFPFGVQDVINFVCKEKIKFIDLSWNIQNSFFELNNILYHPLRKQIKEAGKNPKIVHYSTKQKPWECYVPLRKIYFKYEKFLPAKKNPNFIFKLNLFFGFLKFFFIDGTRFLISPVIKIYTYNNTIKLKLFNRFCFNLLKTK